MKLITVPGSKSISNRALVLASLSNTPTILHNLLECDDIRFLRNALSNFGVQFENLKNNTWKVIPPEKLYGNNTDNFIGNGGTPARFLTALSTIIEGSFMLHGVDRMHERPFSDLFESIKKLGVKIEHLGQREFLPAKFTKDKLKPNHESQITISGTISSQFVSGLLLAASKIPTGLTIEIIEDIPSIPYVKMTVEMLKIWGINVTTENDFKRFVVQPSPNGFSGPDEYTIPADCSSASYPIIYSILARKSITITNFSTPTLQGDEQFLEVAKIAGAKIIQNKNTVTIQPPEKIKSLGKIDFSTMPDVSMSGMVLAAFADGESYFTGLESLRIKECDRVFAMAEGLQKIGFEVQIIGDELKIFGNSKEEIQNSKFEIFSFDDHRIAMVFGIVREILNSKFEISNPKCVTKSWPEFWTELADWENKLRPVSAIILEDRKIKTKKRFLIVQKPRKDHAWQFPQGGVDPEETDIEAAKRELYEECGNNLRVKILNKNPVGIYKYLFPDDFKRHDANIIGAKVTFFQAEYIDGEVEIDDKEIVKYKWVEEANLSEYFEAEYLDQIRNFIKR